MIPGIDPKIDYAFKRVFGLERNSDLLIDLIHAVLRPPPERRIVELHILNPFNDKEELNDKLSILDIKARDQSGALYNVEMQMVGPMSLPQRLLYYAARLYQQQLREGEAYATLRPTIVICFLDDVLFPQTEEVHLSFGLWDSLQAVRLTDDLAIHVLELPKFEKQPAEVRDQLDRWLYFLQHGATLDDDVLPESLNVQPVQKAMGELRELTQSEIERERYEARRKMQHDVADAIHVATQQGLEKGLKQGLAKGELIGAIRLCQEQLGRSPTPAGELAEQSVDELREMVEALRNELLG